MTEYIVTFKTSRQISPEDWEVYNPTLKVSDNTTIKEIAEFYKKYITNSNVEVKIIEIAQATIKEETNGN